MKTEPTEALSWIERRKSLNNHVFTVLLSESETGCRLAFQEGQSSPKIKQLEWVEVYKSIFNADSSFKYAYEIHVNDDGSTILFYSSARKPERFINLKDAKSAAQADFERRVMACLDLKAQQKQALIDTMRGDEEIGLYDDNPKNHGYER